MKPFIEGTITDNSQLTEYDLKIKVLIEPGNSYFSRLEKDREDYDKIILFNGMEPFEINNIRTNIIKYHKYFDKIYSYDDVVVNNCKNAELYSFGSCWVLTDKNGNKIQKDSEFEDFYSVDSKKFKVSFIKSGKNQLPGHQLRHSIPNLLNNRNFDVLFPRHRIEWKGDLFIDSMYHIVVENTQHRNYFTEKIIDCFMSKTIPIYWGCPNIGEYFNEEGILSFDNLEELDILLNNLTAVFYSSRKNIVEENYRKAKEYAFFNKRLDKLIQKIL